MSSDAEVIRTDPDWLAPYNISQGFVVGDQIHLSGQAAIDPETGEIVGEGDFVAQARKTFENIETVLRAARSSLDQVVKVTIYMTDMSHFPKVVELREEVFGEPYPADTIVEVQSLALPELMIEVDAMALQEGVKEG